jgi:hypothetical protein
MLFSGNCGSHRHDFRLVIFQRGNDNPGLSGIGSHKLFGAVTKGVLGEPFRRPHGLRVRAKTNSKIEAQFKWDGNGVRKRAFEGN